MDKWESKDFVVFELVDQEGDQIYDSVESHGFLFSEEIEEDDEFAIITGCEDNNSDEANEGFPQSTDHDSNCDKESDKYEAYEDDKTKTVHDKEQLREQVYDKDTNQALTGTLSSHKSNTCVEISPSQLSCEEDRDDENVFPYGSTSTPKKEYEMKILAGPNDVNEIVQSPDRKELEDKTVRRKSNVNKLKELSTRIRRSFDEVAQHNEDECLNNIPLKDLRHSEIIYQHDQSNKKHSFPDKDSAVSALELKEEGILPGIGMRAVSNEIDTKPIAQNAMGKTCTGKCLERSIQNVNSQKYFSARTKHDNDLNSNQICDMEGELRMDEIKNESFFEIDNYAYKEFVHKCECEPVELEMKTILKDESSDTYDGFLTVTEFIHPDKIEILRGGEVSCRYISIFRQEECKGKYITVAFVNVNMPREKLKLDVPCEEVIEEIYSHFITEVVIYEDDIDIGNNGVLSSTYKDWVIF